jgi:phosphohistidine phosphatase
MHLFLLRHGIAAELGTAGYEDADRPLTSEGKSKLKTIAAAMLKLELGFDLIVSSPYIRARQTAEIVSERLKLTNKLEFTRFLEPHGNLSSLIRLLQSYSSLDNVLLVGHEPSLSELISLLMCGESETSVVMKKGGLAKLHVTSLRAARCAFLEWLLTPKQMSLMAG